MYYNSDQKADFVSLVIKEITSLELKMLLNM